MVGHLRPKPLRPDLGKRWGQEVAIAVEKQESETTILFLKKLSEVYPDKKILFIWDGAGWHKSKKIRDFLKTTDPFELMNFPPYCPELNPQEHVWKALRQEVTHNRLEKDFSVLVKESLEFLNDTDFSSSPFQSLFG